MQYLLWVGWVAQIYHYLPQFLSSIKGSLVLID